MSETCDHQRGRSVEVSGRLTLTLFDTDGHRVTKRCCTNLPLPPDLLGFPIHPIPYHCLSIGRLSKHLPVTLLSPCSPLPEILLRYVCFPICHIQNISLQYVSVSQFATSRIALYNIAATALNTRLFHVQPRVVFYPCGSHLVPDMHQ